VGVAEYEMPAPREGAGTGSAGLVEAAPSSWPEPFLWEITKLARPRLLEAALMALSFAKTVHEAECESRWVGFTDGWIDDLPPISAVEAVAAIQRRANPLVLLRFLPPSATEQVQEAAERLLRQAPGVFY